MITTTQRSAIPLRLFPFWIVSTLYAIGSILAIFFVMENPVSGLRVFIVPLLGTFGAGWIALRMHIVLVEKKVSLLSPIALGAMWFNGGVIGYAFITLYQAWVYRTMGRIEEWWNPLYIAAAIGMMYGVAWLRGSQDKKN